MSEKKKVISVMIPTYNEEENARPIYEAVRDEIRKDCPDYDYEILFIDNKKISYFVKLELGNFFLNPFAKLVVLFRSATGETKLFVTF